MTHTGPAYYVDHVIIGNTFSRQYVLKTGGVAVNLTGYTVRWCAKYGDVSIIKTTADSSLSMPTPSNGTVVLTLSPAETRQIPVDDNMKYELETIAPDTTQMTVLYGDLVGKGGVNLD